MNILLINHYAGSNQLGMEFRPFYLAREWAGIGHRVTIIGASYSHLRNTQPDVREDLAITVEEGVRYRWLRTPRYAGNGGGRVINMAVFVMKLARYARRIAEEEKPDVVICSSTYPLDIYPGELIARGSRACLVFEVHDLWPLTPILLGGYKPWHPYIRILQYMEDRAYAHADLVVSILPNAREYMTGRGLAAQRFVHIPNGVPVARTDGTKATRMVTELNPLVASEQAKGRFLVGYAGSLTFSMDVNLLLDVASMPEATDVSFFIAGDGPTAADHRKRILARSLSNVHMLGRIPKSAVPAFLTSMDALAIPWRANPIYRHGVSPNKIFDYMLAGRPIVQASDASNDIVSDARCGFTVRPGDPRAVMVAIRRLRELPVKERARLGANGQQFVRANHDFRVLATRFLAALPLAAPGVTTTGMGHDEQSAEAMAVGR